MVLEKLLIIKKFQLKLNQDLKVIAETNLIQKLEVDSILRILHKKDQ